jgi:hypothetical protein
MMNRLLLMTLFCHAAFAAPPSKCPNADIPVRVTFAPVYDPTGESARINNDTAIAYEHGKDGVSALIQRCNGTNDLVIDTLSSSPLRKANFSLFERLASNSNSPAFVGATVPFHLKLNDMFRGYSEFVSFTYTTYGGFSFTGQDGARYALRFVNPSSDTGDNTGMQPPDFNSPYMTTKLVLTHIPAATPTATPEQWILSPGTEASNPNNGAPASSQVATLLLESGKAKPTWVTAGQYRVPFKIVVTRK